MSVRVYPISKALGGQFSGVEQSKRGDRITNAMIEWTLSFSVPEIVQATSRKEALKERSLGVLGLVGEARPGASCELDGNSTEYTLGNQE